MTPARDADASRGLWLGLVATVFIGQKMPVWRIDTSP